MLFLTTAPWPQNWIQACRGESFFVHFLAGWFSFLLTASKVLIGRTSRTTWGRQERWPTPTATTPGGPQQSSNSKGQTSCSTGLARGLQNSRAGATWSMPSTSLMELNWEEEGGLILKKDQQMHENVLRIKLYEEGRGGRSRSRSRSRSPRRRRVSRSRFKIHHPSENAVRSFS